MKVLSWNILAQEWIKKSYYKGVDEKILFNRKKRFSTIKKHILEEKADIILLQEVMPYEYKHLVKLLKETHHASPLLPISWNGVYGQSGNVTFIGRNSSSVITEISHSYTLGTLTDWTRFTASILVDADAADIRRPGAVYGDLAHSA